MNDIKRIYMAEQQQTGIINYDPVTTNSLLDKVYKSRNVFPFDTEAKAESERGITSGAVYEALNELKGATTLNRGYWTDLNSLQTGVPVTEEGSIAYVGTNAPYKIYRYTSGSWTDTGQTHTPEISPGNFYTKQEIDGQRQTLETSIADAAVGANYAVLDYVTSVAVTRMQVPLEVRKAGYMISYNPGTGWIKEQYIGVSTDNTEWQKDANWKAEVLNDSIQAIAENAQAQAQAAQQAAKEAETATQKAVSEAQAATQQANVAAQAANEAAEVLDNIKVPLSEISGFVAVDKEGKALGVMSKENVATVLGEIIGTASQTKNGLMPKERTNYNQGQTNALNFNDLNDLFRLYSSYGGTNAPLAGAYYWGIVNIGWNYGHFVQIACNTLDDGTSGIYVRAYNQPNFTPWKNMISFNM